MALNRRLAVLECIRFTKTLAHSHCQCKSGGLSTLCFCFWQILVYLQYKTRFRLNFFLVSRSFFSTSSLPFLSLRFVPFFHLNLIYSFRIACFPIEFDVSSLQKLDRISFSSSTLSNVILRRCYIFDSFTLSLTCSFLIPIQDNCLFHFVFTWNFEII